MTNPLTLIMPLKEGTTLEELGKVLVGNQAAIDAALGSIGTVHFARFVVFANSAPNLLPGVTPGGPLCLSVITSYDGDFDAYIQDFVNKIGDVFNALLEYVVGGAALIPVQNNVQAFTAFIKQNDASQNPPNDGFKLYAAYPCTVQQVLAADPCPGTS